ncbi:MAG: hypothetical protein NT011_11405 [Kiritimatiellaeota bacterium]|nr:hypothetical protein [Kiritimatiellota bacterium]
MDAQNNPVASDKSAAFWRLILLVLCAVGFCLVIGVLALQVTEYLFYKAPPDVWPQPGVGGMVSTPVALSAPAALAAPLSPVTTTTSSAVPAAVSAPASPTGQTSTPVAASTGARRRR